MTQTLFKGGKLLHLDPIHVENADLLVDGDRIVAVGGDVAGKLQDDAVVVDATNKWVMPGLVCGHHHLYSALATGMPLPSSPPASFTEMLQGVWWAMDACLDENSVKSCGHVGGIGGLRTGTTTVVDHHASPAFIEGSLEVLDGALHDVGVRRILCYEVTNRGGDAKAAAGLRAHEALLERCATPWSSVLVGGHANFTLGDDDVRAMGQLAKKHGVGIHLHVAEAVDDEQTTGEKLIARLQRLDALLPGSILAHCVHLDDDELKAVDDAGAWVAHQARSNMNNGVGHADLGRPPTSRTLLGTDGIGADMFAEGQSAYFRAQEAGNPVAPDDILQMLAANARFASSQLGVTVGKLEAGAAADVLLLDAPAGPPVTTSNLGGTFVFRMGSHLVRSVMVGGEFKLDNRDVVSVDEPALNAIAVEEAQKLWQRMRG